jgi:hypothetical protein
VYYELSLNFDHHSNGKHGKHYRDITTLTVWDNMEDRMVMVVDAVCNPIDTYDELRGKREAMKKFVAGMPQPVQAYFFSQFTRIYVPPAARKHVKKCPQPRPKQDDLLRYDLPEQE